MRFFNLKRIILEQREAKMTIAKAREILGKEIKHLSDEEVERFITRSAALIDTVLDMYEAKELNGGGYATKPGFDLN